MPVIPGWLLALMRCPALPFSTRLGPEDKECLRFANIMREMTLRRRYDGVWLHIPNEGKRHMITGAIARALGLIPGAADYLFVNRRGAAFIEFKSAKGRQNDNQQRFQLWCGEAGIRYGVAHTTEEALALLREWEMCSS